MGNCRAVLFDEPTSGLDPESRRLLWNIMLALFQNLPQNGTGDKIKRSCVLTSHSLEEAEALCSRIAIMLKGQIYALGLFAIFINNFIVLCILKLHILVVRER